MPPLGLYSVLELHDVRFPCQSLSQAGIVSERLEGLSWFFTARCYASAVLAMALCPSVCPLQVGVLLKRLNVGSHKQHQTIAQGI